MAMQAAPANDAYRNRSVGVPGFGVLVVVNVSLAQARDRKIEIVVLGIGAVSNRTIEAHKNR
jgi:hypothetical protein